jgi:hypothetical protein
MLLDSPFHGVFLPTIIFFDAGTENHRQLADLFMGMEVSVFGNAGAVRKRDNRADAQWAPFCAAVGLGF